MKNTKHKDNFILLSLLHFACPMIQITAIRFWIGFRQRNSPFVCEYFDLLRVWEKLMYFY